MKIIIIVMHANYEKDQIINVKPWSLKTNFFVLDCMMSCMND